ncbi:MAG: hypothetical protein AB9M53_06325 [Leptothrix sp. (in: b-proteobacteria)]
MSCCNRKREMIAEAQSAMPAPADQPVPDVVPRDGEYATTARSAAGRRADSVRLRYTMTLPITIRGSASGREYQFSSGQSIQTVDPRDAAELLQSRMFRQFA